MGVVKNRVIQKSSQLLILLTLLLAFTQQQSSPSIEELQREASLSKWEDQKLQLADSSSQFRSDSPIETPLDLLMEVLNNENLVLAYEVFQASYPFVGQGLANCVDYTDDGETENIWLNAYSSTFWFDIIDKWFTGLKLDSFFDYADLCYEYLTDTVDYINGLYLQNQETCVDDNDLENAAWSCIMFYISEWIADPIGLSFLNCWLLQNAAVIQLQTKVNSFVDFADLYTSLLFNLLAESLQIRNYALLMQSYQTDGQCADFQFSLANIVRIVIDFDSSNSEPLVQKMRDNSQNSDTFLDQLFNGNFEKKYQVFSLAASFLNTTFSKVKERLSVFKPQQLPNVEQNEGAGYYTIQGLLGLLDGSLGALPYESEGYWCGKNTTSMRVTIVSTNDYFTGGQTEEGMEELYNSIAHLDEVTYNCYEAFDSGLDITSESFTWASIGGNLLNNVGFMYTDVLNVVTQTPDTVEDPYPYFVAYNTGDFVIRIFWSSDITTEDIPGTPRQWYQ